MGTIYSEHGTYRILPAAGGVQLLQRQDQSLMPPCGGGIEPPEGHAAALHQHPESHAEGLRAEEPPLESLPAPMGVRRIDVMVLYTPQARAAAGGAAAIEAEIRHSVNLNNLAFTNSQVQIRFVLVYTGLSTLSDSQDMGLDIFRLRQNPDAQRLRDIHRADLVGLIVASGQYCGVGYLMDRPFAAFAPSAVQVTLRDCLGARQTLAHEFGHNMGLQHDPANAGPPATASFPWSYGHFVDGSFRTIMSYTNQCTQGCNRATNFSNPNVRYQGAPTGIAGQRDNHRTLNAVAAVVAGFRGPGGAPPAAPTDLAATFRVGENGLNAELVWQDASGNENGFRVYRSLAGGPLEEIATLDADTTVYRDIGLEEQVEVRYQVAAFNARGESRGEELALTTPEVVPVTVDLSLPAPLPPSLEPLTVAALTTGPVERADWSFGTDGFGTTTVPAAPGRFEDVVIFPGPGTFAVDVTVTGDLGQTATASGAVSVGTPGIASATDESVVQSVLYGPRGDTGTFESACWSHNASDTPVLVDYTYLARGITNPAPLRRKTTLEAGETLVIPNAVATLFGQEESAGAIRIRSIRSGIEPPRVSTFCRSFVRVDGEPGSFGQLVPESRGLMPDKLITGVLQDEAFVATVLVANLDDTPGVAILRLLDAAGRTVGTQRHLNLGLGGVRFQRLVDYWPEVAEATGPFSIEVEGGNQRFAASATLLEKDSEDQIFLQAVPPGDAPVLFFPRVAKAPSQFGAFLVSRLTAFNPSTVPTELTFELLLRGQNNLDPPTAVRTLAPRSTLDVPDLMAELFGLEEAVGALRLTWANALGEAPRVTTVALNGSGDGGRRFGMAVDAVPVSTASARTVGFAAEQTDLDRTDFGIINLAETGTVVQVTLKDAAGEVLAEATLPLKPLQHLERNLEGIFKDISLGQGREWTLEAEVTQGGPILTYLAKTNVTGDLLFVPGTAMEP